MNTGTVRALVDLLFTGSLLSVGGGFAKLNVRASMAPRRISLSIFLRNDNFLIATVSTRSRTEAHAKRRARPPCPRVYISATYLVRLRGPAVTAFPFDVLWSRSRSSSDGGRESSGRETENLYLPGIVRSFTHGR